MRIECDVPQSRASCHFKLTEAEHYIPNAPDHTEELAPYFVQELPNGKYTALYLELKASSVQVSDVQELEYLECVRLFGMSENDKHDSVASVLVYEGDVPPEQEEYLRKKFSAELQEFEYIELFLKNM